MMEKFPGFEAARLRHDRAGQWVGFVDFTEETEATACKNAMGGAKLDPKNSGYLLHETHTDLTEISADDSTLPATAYGYNCCVITCIDCSDSSRPPKAR